MKMQSITIKYYVVLNHREQNPEVHHKSPFSNNGKLEPLCLNFIIVHMVVWEFGFNSETHKMLQAT